jgi:hypothetical protein
LGVPAGAQSASVLQPWPSAPSAYTSRQMLQVPRRGTQLAPDGEKPAGQTPVPVVGDRSARGVHTRLEPIDVQDWYQGPTGAVVAPVIPFPRALVALYVPQSLSVLHDPQKPLPPAKGTGTGTGGTGPVTRPVISCASPRLLKTFWHTPSLVRVLAVPTIFQIPAPTQPCLSQVPGKFVLSCHSSPWQFVPV